MINLLLRGRIYLTHKTDGDKNAMLHQTTITGFSEPDSLRTILVDCDARRLLLSTHFWKCDCKDAILHVCLNVIWLQRETQYQHNALQIDDTRSYWRSLTLVPGGSGNALENLP